MSERRKGKRGKKKGKEFMDAVYDAYVRYAALRKWQDVEGILATGTPAEAALKEAGHFPERGPYRAIWEDCWQSHVSGAEQESPMLGAIEAAVGDAVERETEERKRIGDRPLAEDPDFKRFVDSALDQLFAEEAGTLEELD